MTIRQQLESLHPSQGARFLFERLGLPDDDDRARYHAVIYTPSERFDYEAELDTTGEVTLTADMAHGGIDSDLESKLHTIARLIARSAARKRAESLPAWPHRILRWRGPGRG
jgi:hypothetical protein